MAPAAAQGFEPSRVEMTTPRFVEGVSSWPEKNPESESESESEHDEMALSFMARSELENKPNDVEESDRCRLRG